MSKVRSACMLAALIACFLMMTSSAADQAQNSVRAMTRSRAVSESAKRSEAASLVALDEREHH